jgi:hypothetical protein
VYLLFKSGAKVGTSNEITKLFSRKSGSLFIKIRNFAQILKINPI